MHAYIFILLVTTGIEAMSHDMPLTPMLLAVSDTTSEDQEPLDNSSESSISSEEDTRS